MCGITGYTGINQAGPILLEGLRRLEYRGYDSAGIAIQSMSQKDVKTTEINKTETNNSETGKSDNNTYENKACVLKMLKATGKVSHLVEKFEAEPDFKGVCGIGHTRWATHGIPSDTNAHPHLSADGKFAVVHNGIIENFTEIRTELQKYGIEFKSETDTEVIVQLLAYNYKGNFKKALMKTIARLTGSYAIGVISDEYPGTIFAAKQASPLIIGVGIGENYFASDITALVSNTKNVIDLDDGEVAEITPDEVKVFDHTGKEIDKEIRHINWDIASAEKSGYEHFMMKEIMEQPQALKATIEPRIKCETLNCGDTDLSIVFDEIKGLDMKKFNRVHITACGSAYHAGYVGRTIIESLCKIQVEAEVASELRYRDPVMDDKTLVIVISQSGETADTIAAMKECKYKGATVLAIVNVVGSSIAKLADHCIYTWAGPEIAVATTKGYTTQVAVLAMFAVWAAGELKTISHGAYTSLILDIMHLPERAQRALDLNTKVKKMADKYYDNQSLFFIGRNMDYAVALEGSLKLKEISYLHSEAYAAGELKHGTIALIEPGRLVVALCCYEKLFEKTVSNIQQVKARGAEVLAVAHEGNRSIFQEADDVLLVPQTDALLVPVIEIIPLQLFAYYVAKKNGCDIDKPKNLAKSVTVE